jgi:hypothetical protein
MGKVKNIKSELKITQDNLIKAQEKLKETEELLRLANEERENLIINTTSQINELCNIHNLFCGIVLDQNNLLELIKLALISKENIKIPYQLYFNEE